MEKRYQVFISSTFADLQEERKAIMDAIMDLNCFPAGMEMFPANDSEQFEYIKTIIDDSDYYVLVLAGRYGSVAEDGKSYTEKEFDYAKEKGIPVLVFVKRDLENIPLNKTDSSEEKMKKLKNFIEKAMKNRLAKYWEDSKELKYEVHSSLSKAFKTHPRTGWVKGNINNNESLLKQLNDLRIENDNLKNTVSSLNEEIAIDNNYLDINIKDLAQGEDTYTIKYAYYGETRKLIEAELNLTWNDIALIVIKIVRYDSQNEGNIKDRMEYEISNLYLDGGKLYISIKQINVILAQLVALGYIENDSEWYEATELGEKLLLNSLLVLRK
ncbi:MAG: DUF4062 domain-containing protein [Clostridium perfringens]|uniref:DUF4062 domain-containing protein n=1 Tax=Clostridium TaxID=1485 RepID=UPI0013E2F446|nr:MULTISPECIES: DUF4062 domain-containing protein [Clostridium]MDU5775767.1 DUF4062 domain-containing protein [Clostridium perfringens]MDU6274173.1 DUF4062 domain-containing protein [Clostridium sp.]NGS98859.1 DUF4062 domain-containing protein [Clostridium perfringens]